MGASTECILMEANKLQQKNNTTQEDCNTTGTGDNIREELNIMSEMIHNSQEGLNTIAEASTHTRRSAKNRLH
uniref:V-SNARE coiled-coil homology domain-containing protein n=1 Tax=Glossina morsitans morsitans TaxID=37546 RepID=A0ABK9NG18_GLOMM